MVDMKQNWNEYFADHIIALPDESDNEKAGAMEKLSSPRPRNHPKVSYVLLKPAGGFSRRCWTFRNRNRFQKSHTPQHLERLR